MKKIYVRTICCAAVALILVTAAIQISSSAQGKAKRLEGTWQLQGAIRDCQTGTEGAHFLGLNTFIAGGSMFATGATNPATGSIGYGVWEHNGGQSYVAVIISFRFNPDGSLAGTQKINKHMELTGSDEFTSSNTLEIIDLAGNVIATRCSVETGRRLEISN
jgi:hypothetical protein